MLLASLVAAVVAIRTLFATVAQAVFRPTHARRAEPPRLVTPVSVGTVGPVTVSEEPDPVVRLPTVTVDCPEPGDT